MHSYSCCQPDKGEFNQVNKLSSILKLVGEPNRLKLLCILRQNEHCVCTLTEHLNLSQSLISHHLKDLKAAGILKDKKRGLYVYYALTAEGQKITDSLFNLPL